jgi:hypothetical protein
VSKLVEAVLNGADPSVVLDEAQTGVPYAEGTRIRTFFDSHGELRFCTQDDVLIDHNSSEQMKWLREVANQLSADSHLLDMFYMFIGNLDELCDRVYSGE